MIGPPGSGKTMLVKRLLIINFTYYLNLNIYIELFKADNSVNH